MFSSDLKFHHRLLSQLVWPRQALPRFWSLSAPDASHLQLESRHRSSGFNQFWLFKYHRRLTDFKDGHGTNKWINPPCQANAVCDPLVHFRVQFWEGVRRRQNLNQEIGREG